jgi:hypothetical protein
VVIAEPSPEFPYNYFVSFAHSRGFGYRIVGRKSRIETASDVETLGDGVSGDVDDPIVIMNWIELAGSPPSTHTPDGSPESTVDGGEQTQ